MRWMVSIAGATISPALERTGSLLCVESFGRSRRERRTLDVEPGACLELIKTVRAEKPDVLLCGALCPQLFHILAADTLDVRPFLCGDAMHLLDLCIRRHRLPDEHIMPGCRDLSRHRFPFWTCWPFTADQRGDCHGS